MSSSTSERIEAVDIDTPYRRLSSGQVFVELLHNDVDGRAAALDRLLARLVDSETRLVWIGNPLRSPLSLERLFLQAAGPEADLRLEADPVELVAMLHRAAAGVRSLLILQQPETLAPEARDVLGRIAPLLADRSPPIQFLFCGTTAFRPIATSQAVPVDREAADKAAPAGARLPRLVLPVLLLLVGIALGGLISAAIPAPIPPEPALLAANTQDRSCLELVSPATSQPPRTDVSLLHQQFESLLDSPPPLSSAINQDQGQALSNQLQQLRFGKDKL